MVTGLSGSGKTAALKALEDLGFFCIDNLPVALLPKLAQLSLFSREMVTKVAIGMDSRESEFLERYIEAFEELDTLGTKVELVFLESDDEVLLKRFSETRRRHPLAKDRSVFEGICQERKLFAGIKERADISIDTSSMSVHDLKRTLWDYFKRETDEKQLQVTLLSFGFRNGLPREANIIFDVRYLPNPYFVSELKDKNGTNPDVFKFVFSSVEAEESFQKFRDILKYLLPLYEAEGKSYLTIAIGCTGGKHRSVAFVERLADALGDSERKIRVLHRDLRDERN